MVNNFERQKSAFKLEINKDLTFIVIIIDIDYWYKLSWPYRPALSPGVTLLIAWRHEAVLSEVSFSLLIIIPNPSLIFMLQFQRTEERRAVCINERLMSLMGLAIIPWHHNNALIG